VNSTLAPRATTRWGYTTELVEVRPLPTSGERIPASEYVIRLIVTSARD
jgi:hypothetical protein